MDIEKEYFRSLDERLHFVVETYFYDGYVKRPRQYDDYHKENKLSEFELAIVLGLMNKKDYAIMPINTGQGFKQGFAVYKIQREGMQVTAKEMLKFTDTQLPEGVEWADMADVYMGTKNLELLAMAGIEKPKRNRVHYEY